MKHLAALAVMALLLAACAGSPPAAKPAAPPQAAAPVPPPDPKTQMAALETRLADLVEEQRLKLDPKAHPLTIDPELSRIARARAADMAAKNYLAHAAPGGETSASLLMAQDAQYQGLLGENLAAQYYVAQSGVDPDTFARRFLDTWMASPPHRENLSFPDYDRTGIGAAVNGDTVYVAQLFSTTPNADTSKSGTAPATVTRFDSPVAAKAATPPPSGLPGLRGAH